MLSCLGTTKHTASLESSESPSDAKNSESMKLQEVSAPPPITHFCLEGMLYFIKGLHVREFGFPRIPNSDGGKSNPKPFKWKKTNFMTDLPKHSPAVRYLVAHTNN
jgi:hypothetical protein